MSVREETFCRAYVETGNASESYRRAKYGGKRAFAGQAASRLLKKDKIQQKIAEIRGEMSEAISVKSEVMQAELGAMATFDPAAIFRPDGTVRPLDEIPRKWRAAIKEVRVRSTKDGQVIEVKLEDKVRAIEALAKMTGAIQPRSKRVRASVRVPGGGAAILEFESSD